MIPVEKIITAVAEDNIISAMEIMVEHRVSSLLILNSDDDNIVEGIVTSHDLMDSVVNDSKNSVENAIGSVMSTDIISIEQTKSLDEASELMKTKRTHHLVITDENSNLVGILSTFDLLKDTLINAEMHPWMAPDVFSLPDR